MSREKRIGQRDVKPHAVKFRIMEFFDPSDGTYKFLDNDGNAIFTIDPSDGTLAFGSALIFSTAVTFGSTVIFGSTVTFNGETTFSDNLKYYSLEESGYSLVATDAGSASASTASAAPEDANAAFDSDFSSKWVAVADNTPWLKYEFPATQTITKYVLTTGNDAPDRGPKSWQFQGSNNDTDWTTIETKTNEALVGIGVKYTFYVTNTTAYKYYRINITANNGSADTQLAEFQMYEDA